MTDQIDNTYSKRLGAERSTETARGDAVHGTMATEFRLLGPVEVVIDYIPIPIVIPRQEITLAVLLLRPNHVVSVGRMIAALWADQPPRTATSQVQITISALRKLVGDAVIVTRPPGYLIQIPAAALDVERFEILAASAAAAAARQRTAEAAQFLRSALTLWRGHALEGVKSEIICAAATRLDERRICVLHDCIDLELRLGKHRELVSELAELAARQPLNERFRYQLMLALYRAGRQAEALEAFRLGRKIMQTELGLDPDGDLCRLERAILNRDALVELPGARSAPVLSGPAAGSGPTAVPRPTASLPVPRQMPRTITEFTGRQKLLSQITQALCGKVSSQGDVPVVVLTGLGGTGKTALAIRAAHLLSREFPDGQMFVRLDGGTPNGAASILDYLLHSVGINPEGLPGGVESRAALYRSWLADRRVLIVIDDAADISQVLPFLPGTTGCAVIVTSGQRLSSLESAHHIKVGSLDEETAFRLLVALIGAQRVGAEEQSARELVRLCAGLPLALRIVAAKLADRPHWPLDRMVRHLADEGRRLDELDLDGAGVRATLSVAYDRLGDSERALFRRLSRTDADDFASWISAPLLDRDVGESDDILHKLVQSHLVDVIRTEDGATRFQLPDLVRIYATERLSQEELKTPRLVNSQPIHAW